MSMEDMNREISYQHIAELHADAERYRQVRLSKRSRQRRSRGRLGRLLRPSGVAARANGILGGIISPPWSRRDPIAPSRPARACVATRPGPGGSRPPRLSRCVSLARRGRGVRP
jgi:hypothetical protein